MHNSKENSHTRDAMLWQQHKLIAQNYDIETGDSIVKLIVYYYLRDGTIFPVRINFDNYPESTMIKLPPQLEEFIKEIKVKEMTLENLDPEKPVVTVLDEIQRIVFKYDQCQTAIKILEKSISLPSEGKDNLSIKFSILMRKKEHKILVKMSNYPEVAKIEIDRDLIELIGLNTIKEELIINGDLEPVICLIQTLEDRARKLNHRLKDLEELMSSPIVKHFQQKDTNKVSITVKGKERLQREKIILSITFPEEYPYIPPIIQLEEPLVDISNNQRLEEEIVRIELDWNANMYLEPTIRGILQKMEHKQKFVCLVCRDPIRDVSLAAQCQNCERPYHFLCPNCGKRCFEETQLNFGKCVACLEKLVLRD
ncbi:MAG: hypothetical protein ACFFCQ_12750 [Promethearchaeota archaeon]